MESREPSEVKLSNIFVVHQKTKLEEREKHQHAYAPIMYMGTMRDNEFYVAMRVMIKSFVGMEMNANLVINASLDFTRRWDQALWLQWVSHKLRKPLDVPSFSPFLQNLSNM